MEYTGSEADGRGKGPGEHGLNTGSLVQLHATHFAGPYSDVRLPLSPRLLPCQVELLCRVATLLLRLHMQQLMGTPAARPLLLDLQQLLHARVQGLKDVMGFNLAAMNHLQRGLRERQGQPGAGDVAAAAAAVLPLKRKAAAR